MTVPATTRRAGPFSGNGSTVNFPFAFKVFTSADIAVAKANASGAETPLAETADYTVALNPDQDAAPGGTITVVVAPAAGETLVITGSTTLDQQTDLPTGGRYSAVVVENALDKLTILLQQLAERAGRSLTLRPTAAGASTTLPSPDPNSLLGWDDGGTALINRSPSDLVTVAAYSDWRTDLFSGDGTATVFTLSSTPGNVNNCDVAVNGVVQTPGVDYTVSEKTLTFTSAPPAGVPAGKRNIVVRYGHAVPVGTYDQIIEALLQEGNGVILDYEGSTDFIFAVIDAAKRRLAAWKADGTMLAKLGMSLGVANGLTFTRNADLTYTLSLGTTPGELPIGNSLAKGSYDNTSYLWGVADSEGRRLLTVYTDGTVEGKFASPELIAARGSRSTLDQRLSQFLTPYGAPKSYIFNEHRLRRFRYLRRKRLLSESAQIVVALIGDSYTHEPSRYSTAVASTLISELGDAGGGWVGFASLSGDVNGNARPSSYPLTRVGTWDQANSSNYYLIPGPDLGQAKSSTPGDRQSIAGPASPTLSAVRFFWNGTADGVMRYRWNGGSWTTINVQGSGVQSALLSGLPSSGAWTLDLEVVSGTCQPCGVDIQSAASGVRVHKLGCTGSRTQQWAAVDATQWQASISSLAPQLVTIMHGTNDQFAARTPAQFAADLTTIITRVRAAVPSADVAVVMPAENQYGNPTSMALYAAAAVDVALAQGCAYLDTQYLFGDASNPAEYGSAGAIPLYSSDLIHPEAATGGRVIADGILRLLTTV